MKIFSKNSLMRESETRILRSKIFIVCEGDTESIYFSKLINNKHINNAYILKPTVSNPYKIYKEIVSCQIKKCVVITFKVFKESLFDYFKFDDKAKKKLLKRFDAAEIKNDSILPEADLISIIKKIVAETNTIATISFEIYMKYLTAKTTYDCIIDKMFLVADRDMSSFNELQLKKVIDGCREKSINFILTNPCIEFYFLLHFTNAKRLSKRFILENKKSGKFTYIYRELKKHDSNYGKTNIDIVTYIKKYRLLKKNISEWTTEIKSLCNNPGSNIVTLVDYLLSLTSAK